MLSCKFGAETHMIENCKQCIKFADVDSRIKSAKYYKLNY